MEKENLTTPANSILYECKDCGCQIIDMGDGHSEMTKPQGLFSECVSCEGASTRHLEQLGKLAAERVNDAFMKMLRKI